MLQPADLSDDAWYASSPTVRSDVILRTYGNDAVVWAPHAPAPVALDAVATVVYQLLDGSATIRELTADVHEVIGIPEAVAEAQLRRVIGQLTAGLVLEGVEGGGTSGVDDWVFPAPPSP